MVSEHIDVCMELLSSEYISNNQSDEIYTYQ
jgi:hypothetical protein